MILAHLIDPAYTAVLKATPKALIDAQANTLNWLDSPVGEGPSQNEKALARQAFAGFTNPDTPEPKNVHNILALRAPAAVRHLVTMLAEYDWAFMEQAKELRGFVVAKLLKEAEGSRASDRLRALQLIGTLTEVASFTTRSEVTLKSEDSSEIEDRLRARLKALLPPILEVQDAEVLDIAVVKHEPKIA